MALTIQTDPLPLRVDEHGVIRVGDSQVLLDNVIQEFNNGAEPEATARGYPTLNLADVYGVIAYYLRHPKDVDNYIHGRKQEAEGLFRKSLAIREKSIGPTQPDVAISLDNLVTLLGDGDRVALVQHHGGCPQDDLPTRRSHARSEPDHPQTDGRAEAHACRFPRGER